MSRRVYHGANDQERAEQPPGGAYGPPRKQDRDAGDKQLPAALHRTLGNRPPRGQGADVIAQDTIERVRRETNIVALIGETVKLAKRGRNHVGLCPFHQEKTGSFNVNDERNLYYCFGCQASGDAIKWVRETQGLDFAEAVRFLADRAGIPIQETGSELERRQAAEARRRRDELYDIGNAAAAFFERALHEHPLGHVARAELGRRGLVPDSATGPIADALQAFRVGYAPYGWDSLARHFRDLGMSHASAEKVGLLRPRSRGAGHYDVFRHRLMFAVLDTRGRVVAFSGRALEEPTADELAKAGVQSMGTSGDGAAAAKYYNSIESPIFRKSETLFGLYQARQGIHQAGDCVVVEGNFDVLSLHARGIKNVVAPLGTAFTSEQGKLVKRFTPTVKLLFDGDAAGQRATRKARDACREAELRAKVATLPEGKDPDDVVRAEGRDGIDRILGASRSMLEYLIDSTLDRGFTASDPAGRAEKIREVTELIASEPDPNAQALAAAHADAIAERLGIADARTFRALAASVHRSLAEAEGRVRPDHDRRRAQPPERARSPLERGALAREILGIFLDFPHLLATDEATDVANLLEGEAATAIAALRQTGWADETARDPAEVLAKLPPSIHSFAAARLAAPRHERLESARQELRDNFDKLRKQEHKRNKAEVVDEIHRAAATGDESKEIALLREQDRRARQRYGY